MPFPASKRFEKRAKRAFHKRKLTFMNMTALIDMFLIIIIFLLRSYVDEGKIPPMTSDLVLPKSLSVDVLKYYGAVIMMTQDKIYYQEQEITNINKLDSIKTSLKVDTLFYHLNAYKDAIDITYPDQKLDEIDKQAAKNVVTIIGDENVPFSVLKKILYTCNIAGFNAIFLATEKEASQSIRFN